MVSSLPRGSSIMRARRRACDFSSAVSWARASRSSAAASSTARLARSVRVIMADLIVRGGRTSHFRQGLTLLGNLLYVAACQPPDFPERDNGSGLAHFPPGALTPTGSNREDRYALSFEDLRRHHAGHPRPGGGGGMEPARRR